jgi:hypothetical protein
MSAMPAKVHRHFHVLDMFNSEDFLGRATVRRAAQHCYVVVANLSDVLNVGCLLDTASKIPRFMNPIQRKRTGCD